MTLNVTLLLIIITTVMSIYAWRAPDIYKKWMFNPYQVYRNREYFRFLSSGFIHSNYGHLFFNMFALFFFGSILEEIYKQRYDDRLGITFVLITYLGGIIFAHIKTYFKYRSVSYYNSLGASGGVASVLFASILNEPTEPICFILGICFPGFLLGALYLIYSYYQGKRMADNINHDAHLFGSLFGILFTIFLRPRIVIEFFQALLNFNLSEFPFLF